MGGSRCTSDVQYVVEMAKAIADAENNEADEDDADFDNMSLKDILKMQMTVAMIQVKDPSKLVNAVGNLWSAFAAVIMVLKLRFAFLTALALGVASLVEFPLIRIVGPPLSEVLGPDLKHWTHTIITSSLRIVLIFVAFWMATVIV